MAQLFVALFGAFQKLAGSGFATSGEDLEREHWRGAELGSLDSFPDVWGAVSEAEFHDWNIGVHHPLFLKDGPARCDFFAAEPEAQEQALRQAATSAQAAHHVGARYILFDLEPPASADVQILEVAGRLFERLAAVQAEEKIRIALRIDPSLLDGERFVPLFQAHPALSLCVDAGALGQWCRSRGTDPLAACGPYLPWARHLRLYTATWDVSGHMTSRIPTGPGDTRERWPEATPSADLAALILSAQPGCEVVLAHDPKAVSPERLEECHAWVAELAARY